MPTHHEQLYRDIGDPYMKQVHGQTITRRKRGSESDTESIIGAIVDKDIAASVGAAGGGYVVDPQGQRSVRFARVDIPATYEVYPSDQYVIDCEVWDVVGVTFAEDAIVKSVDCRLNVKQTGRLPRTQR